ncbi:hypothetical protein Sfulv_61690 [Streptomyces fulvorobeus]|uniref:Uncharacterized protein n=1 Tax=Streptomyces fulvorobeus TaxID=284028 RepID=A0A7J0CG20_9ACTN|nr:hypothetical protein Sfulv_61690 [Streptomyces fulvorobeus]
MGGGQHGRGASARIRPARDGPNVAERDHEWRQLALDGLLFAGVLWAASAPASLAVHMTVLREEAGRPVRPVGDILLWGTLGLSIELTAFLVYL